MSEAALRVLLVDDDEDEHVIVGDLLRAACPDRFELTWAPTYELGLQAILASSCDVCLIDYRLGLRSGLELLTEVTAMPGHPQAILLTGEGDRGVDVTATQAGAADYLIKGEMTAALLERSIRYAVERGRTQKALREVSELAQSMNLAKSAFLATMSHEIRTPMNAILGMADMLWESQLDSEQRQYVDVFRRAGSGLLALINDILDLSKIEAGHLELERVEFDLEAVMDQAIELTAVKAQAKGVALLGHLAPAVPTRLIGDPSRLRQIFINLLGNAIKFTDSGEIVLSARSPESGESGPIHFAVSDTGIGIPPDKIRTIFDDFKQADASTTRKYGGTGLGLGISLRLVQAMGGILEAASTVGQGSTFYFDVQFDRWQESAGTVCVAPAILKGRRVLVFHDNATSCRILRETLTAWGWESDEFRIPVGAPTQIPAATAEEKAYSLVILDVCTPGVDGLGTASEIRRILPGSLPIVMLSSFAHPGDAARARESGLSGYAIKPVPRSRLLGLLTEAVNSRERVEQPPPATMEVKEEAVKPARILLADDSEDNRMLVRAYLKGSPYHLTFEEDGQAAVDRFRSSAFDLILMDVQMRELDGLSATRAIRLIELERNAVSTPIIALTADAGSEDVERSRIAGCDAHLSKPISKLALLAAIEQYRR